MKAQATSSGHADGHSKLKFECEFARMFYGIVNTPLAISALSALEEGAWGDLCGLPLQLSDYDDPKQFAEDYQVVELLRKSSHLPGYDDEYREAAARTKFLGCEAHNAATNTRLWCSRQPEWFGEFSAQVLRILGPLDTKALDSIESLGNFGPGVNVGVRNDGLVPSIKYEAVPVCTPKLAPFLKALIPNYVLEFKGGVAAVEKSIKLVPGNKHFTVPKNFEIDRCAASEPLWNSYHQAGIGSWITRRLERFGVDLHSQEYNQFLASMAHVWGLATIDLSSASDLMARVMVKLALCYNGSEQGRRWHHLLDNARSPFMKMGDSLLPLEMFSSMGNGFTFPLQTAIFLAVIRTVVPSERWDVCTCYGDDIIVPQEYASQLVDRLEYLGLKVNSKKTCLAGRFFESCGTDWFDGHNVRPFYLRQEAASPIPYALSAANALRAWCIRVYGYLPERFHKLWKWCKGQIPVAFRHPVPKELGDVGLHVSLTEALLDGVKPVSKENSYWEGYIVVAARVKTVMKDRRTPGVLVHGIKGISRRGDVLENASLKDWALSQRSTAEMPASLGLEPLRGIFGRTRTERHVVLWKDDFNWAIDA